MENLVPLERVGSSQAQVKKFVRDIHHTRPRARLNKDWVRRAKPNPSPGGDNNGGSGSSQFGDDNCKNPRKKHFSNLNKCQNSNFSK